MSRLVLDASATANFLLPDEDNTYGDAVLAYVQQHGALVPTLWNYEINSILTMACRRKRIKHEYRKLAFERLLTLKIDYWDGAGDDSLMYGPQIAQLADDYRLSSYDASYLFVAERESLTLATLDEELTRAAKEVGIKIFSI